MINLHASHPEDRDQQDSCLCRHLQSPYNKDGKDCECEVRNDCACTVEEGESDYNIDRNAVSWFVLVPEVADRGALKDGDEEEDSAGENRYGHGGVDDPLVHRLDRDTKKEKSNRNL